MSTSINSKFIQANSKLFLTKNTSLLNQHFITSSVSCLFCAVSAENDLFIQTVSATKFALNLPAEFLCHQSGKKFDTKAGKSSCATVQVLLGEVESYSLHDPCGAQWLSPPVERVQFFVVEWPGVPRSQFVLAYRLQCLIFSHFTVKNVRVPLVKTVVTVSTTS